MKYDVLTKYYIRTNQLWVILSLEASDPKRFGCIVTSKENSNLKLVADKSLAVGKYVYFALSWCFVLWELIRSIMRVS